MIDVDVSEHKVATTRAVICCMSIPKPNLNTNSAKRRSIRRPGIFNTSLQYKNGYYRNGMHLNP
jgi:hypothetical protein